MKPIILFFAVFFQIAAAAQSTSVKFSPLLAKATPESVAISSERLALIDDMLEKAVSNEDLPGIVALIARNGKIVFHNAYGMADNTSAKAMENDAIFRIASQTKAITSTAVMILWEEGKFRLDDRISAYIPEFGEAHILDTFNEEDSTYTVTPASDQITIRDLITHTSGIGYGVIDGDNRFKKYMPKLGSQTYLQLRI